MRFKTFLQETDSDISLVGFDKNFETILKRELILCRGTRIEDSDATKKFSVSISDKDDSTKVDVTMFKVSKRTVERKSATKDDTLLNIAAKWENVPNRKLSYFTTQSRGHASKFSGKISVIIPADNIKQFAWSAEDFNWEGTGPKQAVGDCLSQAKTVLDFFRTAIQYGHKYGDLGDKMKAIAVKFDLGTEMEVDYTTTNPFELQLPYDKIKNFAKMMDYMLKNIDMIKDAVFNIPSQKDFYLELEDLNRILDKHGSNGMQEILSEITPTNWGIKVFNSLEQVPLSTKSGMQDEIWFEGDYIGFHCSIFNQPIFHKNILLVLQAIKDHFK